MPCSNTPTIGASLQSCSISPRKSSNLVYLKITDKPSIIPPLKTYLTINSLFPYSIATFPISLSYHQLKSNQSLSSIIKLNLTILLLYSLSASLHQFSSSLSIHLTFVLFIPTSLTFVYSERSAKGRQMKTNRKQNEREM